MAIFEIPLDNTSPAFNMFADLESVSYQFKFKWNDRVQIWIFDLIDSEDTPIFLGKPFQTDVNFLLQSASVTKPPGLLFCMNTRETGLDADRFTIGGDVKFLYDEAT